MNPGKAPMGMVDAPVMDEGMSKSPAVFNIGENMEFLETHVQAKHPIADKKQPNLMRFLEE
jgi:hypothetical protein